MPHTNRVKAAMREGRLAYGYNLAFPAPWVVDILAKQPFDFVWLDGEHGPFGLEQLEHMCRAAEAAGVTPIARVPDIKASTILRFLDRGIQGVLGPHNRQRGGRRGTGTVMFTSGRWATAHSAATAAQTTIRASTTRPRITGRPTTTCW